MEEIVAPDFGESVFEASVGKWFKSSGETVAVGEAIVELHTDKAVQEINAVRNGVIGTILKDVDDIVRPGEALCEFQSGDAAIRNDDGDAETAEELAANVSNLEIETTTQSDETTLSDDIGEAETEDEDDGYVTIQFSPFVEVESEPDDESSPTVAIEEIESPEEVSGDSDLMVSEDVVSDESDEIAESSDLVPSAQVAELRQIAQDKPVRRERLSRRRLTTARRMVQVQSEAVMTTTYNEVDMHEVIRIRRDFGDQFLEANGVKLGFMSFFVKAVMKGLKAFPILNAELDDDELIYKEYFDIGIAVASDHGLVVPVIRDADEKPFASIEREIRGFADKARTGSFNLADLVGGTFTITNGGVFGSMLSTPILNPPQVGILGMHNIVDRPAVVDGQITIRPMMYVAVTYDHRVVEGAHAVQFLMEVKRSLEAAELLMLAN